MKPGRMSYGAACVFLLASIQACVQPQQVIHPPCAAPQATIHVKSSAELSLTFGNDAIQTALDTMARHRSQHEITSTTELTGLGTDAAVRAAEANGKTLKPQDKAVLESYLREDVVPAIQQSPTCGFRVSAPTKREVSVEDVYLEYSGDKHIVKVRIANTGQAGARFINVIVRNILDGTKPLSGQADMVLSPGQWRNVSNPQATFSLSDIGSGKKKLVVIVQLSYTKEAGSQPVAYQEEWEYDPLSHTFKQSPVQ
jgi:hypothetical protein